MTTKYSSAGFLHPSVITEVFHIEMKSAIQCKLKKLHKRIDKIFTAGCQSKISLIQLGGNQSNYFVREALAIVKNHFTQNA